MSEQRQSKVQVMVGGGGSRGINEAEDHDTAIALKPALSRCGSVNLILQWVTSFLQTSTTMDSIDTIGVKMNG